jgi:hypothetical protein
VSKPTQCRAPVALLRSVRLAIDTGDIALAAMVVENAQERRAESLGSIMQGITLVFGNLPLSESIEGRKLMVSITNADEGAQRAIRAFRTARTSWARSRVGSISMGVKVGLLLCQTR